MPHTAVLSADLQTPRPAPFLLFLDGDEHRVGDPEFLTHRLTQSMRVGDEVRSEAITKCVLTASFLVVASPAMPLFLLPLLWCIIDTRRELGRIREQRLLIAEGRLLCGEVVKCRGGWAPGVHEDSGYSYEVKVWYSFRTPEGLPLGGEAAADRDDLKKAQLPGAGTPVLVLYRNQTNYRLL